MIKILHIDRIVPMAAIGPRPVSDGNFLPAAMASRDVFVVVRCPS